jgi:hypothetical protein
MSTPKVAWMGAVMRVLSYKVAPVLNLIARGIIAAPLAQMDWYLSETNLEIKSANNARLA